jgi:hypothetical protein
VATKSNRDRQRLKPKLISWQFTARLEAAPLQSKIKVRFSANCEAAPLQSKIKSQVFSKL